MLLQVDSTQIELARETLYWAKVSGLSDAVVAILGLTGILSILVTRWGLLSQAKRAQVEDAVVLCEEMRKEIVPLLEQMLANFSANNVTRFVSDGSKVSFPVDALQPRLGGSRCCLPPLCHHLQLSGCRALRVHHYSAPQRSPQRPIPERR
jgi:hypothetical protein